jgi:hypothetical protein
MTSRDRIDPARSWRPIAAALLATALPGLIPANGAAQPASDRYEARLARPAPTASVTVGGVEWSCESVSCLAETSQDLVHVKACRALAAEVGRIESFGRSGAEGLGSSDLETCNEVAGSGRGDDAVAKEEESAPTGKGGDGGAAEEEEASPVAEVARKAERAASAVAQKAGEMIQVDPAGTAARTEPEPFVYYRIVNRHSGKPAAVSGGHLRNGASVIQWADRGQPDILWRPIPARDGTYKLRNRNSGRFLAVSGGKRDNGQDVIQWEDADQGDVHWRFEPGGGGHVKIRNAATGKILIVPEGMRKNGANIVQWEDVDRPHARWRLQPAADIPRECTADRGLARREGPDTRPDLEVQDIQVKEAKVADGRVFLLRVEALIRNRSAGTYRGHGKVAFVHENGGNRLIKPGTVGTILDSPIGPGETVRVSDLFVVPKRQESEVTFGRVMKAIASAGASETDNAIQAIRDRYVNDDGEPTGHVRQLMAEGAGVPSDLRGLFRTGQRQTIQVQLEPAGSHDRWDEDLRLCNNFLQLSFVVNDRGMPRGFRVTQKGPDSYRDFHRHRVPVGGN